MRIVAQRIREAKVIIDKKQFTGIGKGLLLLVAIGKDDTYKDVSYLAYPVIIKENSGVKRKWLRENLEKEGIENRPLFGCIPTQQPAYSYLKEFYKDRLPVADFLGRNAFYIGCHQYLQKEDLDYIIKVFKKVLAAK